MCKFIAILMLSFTCSIAMDGKRQSALNDRILCVEDQIKAVKECVETNVTNVEKKENYQKIFTELENALKGQVCSVENVKDLTKKHNSSKITLSASADDEQAMQMALSLWLSDLKEIARENEERAALERQLSQVSANPQRAEKKKTYNAQSVRELVIPNFSGEGTIDGWNGITLEGKINDIKGQVRSAERDPGSFLYASSEDAKYGTFFENRPQQNPRHGYEDGTPSFPPVFLEAVLKENPRLTFKSPPLLAVGAVNTPLDYSKADQFDTLKNSSHNFEFMPTFFKPNAVGQNETKRFQDLIAFLKKNPECSFIFRVGSERVSGHYCVVTVTKKGLIVIDPRNVALKLHDFHIAPLEYLARQLNLPFRFQLAGFQAGAESCMMSASSIALANAIEGEDGWKRLMAGVVNKKIQKIEDFFKIKDEDPIDMNEYSKNRGTFINIIKEFEQTIAKEAVDIALS